VRNAGAREARGEYLVFIDADTRIKNPEVFFSKAEKIFRDDQDIVALTVFIWVSKEAETLADKIILGFFNYLFLIMNNFLGIGASSGEFQMIRADAFRKIGGFNENLVTGEDHDMFRRLAKVGKTHLEKSLVAYHDGRRAHAIGWPKLLWLWTRDTISILLFKKSASKIWERVC
jgi:GT2 family glycosyltransferase